MRPGSASRARCPASGPSVERGPARRTTNATTGPTCLARPVRNVASQQAWSCQRRTPRPCRCISLRSAARWRQAVTPPSSSMAPATILLPRLRSPKTSLWCACHPMLPNSTRSKTSGNISAATNSPSPSSTTTTTSLIKPATHGTSLNKIQCASPQSPPEHGRLSMIRAVGIRCQNPAQMCLAQDNDVVHTFTPDGSDQPFDKAILPRRGRCNRLVPNANGTQSACDDGAIDPIAVSDHVTGSLVPRKGLGYLTSNPLCCRVGCDVDPDESVQS